MAAVVFTASAFPPLALGFFGLGTGYLIYGPKELLGWPKGREGDEAAVARSLGVWGIWLPGFCQFVTGIILFVGLTWFQVFAKTAPFYMAALASPLTASIGSRSAGTGISATTRGPTPAGAWRSW